MTEVTRILSRIEQGDTHAAAELLPLVYDELRRLAASRLMAEKPDHTLQATALVHEAYVRLVDGEPPRQWNSRGHFFQAAAEAMRRILVEAARKLTLRAGGEHRRRPLPEDLIDASASGEVIDLDDALARFEAVDQRACVIVHFRVFCGMTFEEIAACTGVSLSTVKRDWAYARAWLARELCPSR